MRRIWQCSKTKEPAQTCVAETFKDESSPNDSTENVRFAALDGNLRHLASLHLTSDLAGSATPSTLDGDLRYLHFLFPVLSLS